MDERSLILVVDDDRMILDIAEEEIGGHYDVVLAQSGIRAIELLENGCEPELILLDIDMPGMDGYETLRRIRKIPDNSTVPVIFLTGLTGSEAELTGFKFGAQDYITKPFVRDNLIARIRLRIESGRQARQQQEVSQKLNDIQFDEEQFLLLTKELTPVEKDIARLIIQGCDNREIARQLFLSSGYIRNLSTIIYSKLDVHSRRELRELMQ